MTTHPAITLNEVSKDFGSKGSKTDVTHALRSISLTIQPGEIVALLGPNGAGKTTAFDIILGLTRPTSGDVAVFGMPPKKAIAQELIGAVMQTGGLLPELTVEQTIRMIASTYKNHAPIEEHLRRHNLLELRKRRVTKCSGGEQQRIRFALATLANPKVIVLDEPTAGMDPVKRRQFWDDLSEEARRGTTVVFTTHYLEEAHNFAQRIVLLNRGEIYADGTVADIEKLTHHTMISAELPAECDAQLAAQFTGAQIHRQGQTVQITTPDSDALARHLLTATPATNLRIESAGLDDVFYHLSTQED